MIVSARMGPDSSMSGLQIRADIAIIYIVCRGMPFGGKLLKRMLCCLVLCASLLCSLMACGVQPLQEEAAPLREELPQSGDYGLAAAVLYDGEENSAGWQDICDLLEQSVVIGLTVEAVDVTAFCDLSGYDLVIPDASLLDSGDLNDLVAALVRYTENGGYVLLENGFYQVMPKDYLGVSQFTILDGCPLEMTYPEVGDDLGAIQEVIADLASLYGDYYEAEALLEMDYGRGFVADTATVLAQWNGQAIYTYNQYGAGGVLMTNPLLPNVYSLGNLSMTGRTGEETAFANTTASCNQLLYSRFAAFVAKQKFGYALNRVFGYHGSPSMSWELHYEEITAFQHNSMGIFDAICREYQQIPSFTIIRSSYWWFLRTETVTYLRNQAENGYEFQMDYDESAYSSGTHIVTDGQWLHINSIENAGSYFRDYPEYNYRACPCFGDLDGDGEIELVSGSEDGYLYFYDNLNYDDRLSADSATCLTDEKGLALHVAGFSAPQALDLNGDGVLDLLCGSSDGCIYWYEGRGDGTYLDRGLLLNTDISGQALPAVGDVNGDGVADLAVGSDQGILLLYYGQQTENGLVFDWTQMESYTRICGNAELGDWLAPAFVDWNGDGMADLAVGTFDGYIAILTGDGQGDMAFDGYIDLDEMNYKGNSHVKFGNYCVPCFYDVDGDGAKDLICGSLEYGLAYPIDSEYFPYRAELQAQFDYAARNHLYVGVHHYTNGFASAQRESYELQRHKEAFASYGWDFEGLGTNAHTWYQSVLGDTQTLSGEYAAGLLWNSGFSSPGDTGVAPQYGAENVICLPFFLQKDGEDTILVQNNSVLPYLENGWTEISARYKMPMCVYYHCDFVYVNDAGARDYAEKVQQFQWQYGYNFVREDQLMAASAAAYNLEVAVQQQGNSLHLTALEQSQSGDLYDALAQNAMGVEVEFAENIDASSYETDAQVWYREGNSLYLSLAQPVTVSRQVEDTSCLRQVNLPAEIRLVDNGADVKFLADGMLQVVAYGQAQTSSVGWTVTEQNGNTVFTKYGSADTLLIRYAED